MPVLEAFRYSQMAEATDLVEHIDWTGTECLNCADPSSQPWLRCLKQGARDQDELVLSSDCDEQLLLNIKFTQRVKLSAIKIRGPENSAPKTIKIFANTLGFDFEDTESQDPTQVLVASSNDEIHSLKMLSFHGIQSLSIFIEDNLEGGEVTTIKEIQFLGGAIATTDMKDFKKVEE